MHCRLLGVVVDQLLDLGFDDLDFRENLVCSGGPLERLRVLIPMGNVVLDPLNQDPDRRERTPSDGLTSYSPEP